MSPDNFPEFWALVSGARVTVFGRPAVLCEGWRVAFLVQNIPGTPMFELFGAK